MNDILKYALIKNCCAMTCFTVLAVVFRKWWIALFALLFMTFVESKFKSGE